MLNSISRVLLLSLCVLGLAVPLLTAQTPQTPSSSGSAPAAQQPSQPATPQTGTMEASAATQEVAVSPSTRTLDQPAVRELGSGGNWFSNNFDWLHWGPVGVTSAEALYSYSEQDLTAAPGTARLSAGIFQTNIAFSKRMQHSWLVWQYNPRLYYLNGEFSQALTNQDSTFDVLFHPSPRWAIGVSDSFSYYGGKNTLNDRVIAGNNFAGSVTNPFLNSGQSTLANSVGIPVTYNASARTNVTVSPFFSYLQTSPDGPPQPGATPLHTSLYQFGARAQLDRVTSPSQSIGLFYIYQISEEQDFTNTTYFNSVGASLSRRLGRSLFFGAELGGSNSRDSVRNYWTGVGSVSLSKSFRHSSLQATYSRDAQFTGLVGNQYSDHGSASFSHRFGRRADMGAGFGYLSGSSLGGRARGKYANGAFNYRLRANVSLFFGYVHYWQTGNGAQLISGEQSQFQTGLRWAPLRRTGT